MQVNGGQGVGSKLIAVFPVGRVFDPPLEFGSIVRVEDSGCEVGSEIMRLLVAAGRRAEVG